MRLLIVMGMAAPAIVLSACSDGTATPADVPYDDALSCYVALMGVNAVNSQSSTGEELRGATSALMTMRQAEMDGTVDSEKVSEDIHRASSEIQDIMALATSPEGAEALAAKQSEASDCSDIFGG